MEVFIVFLLQECMKEIIGVYDTEEKANDCRENFMKKTSSAIRCSVSIIQMEVQ